MACAQADVVAADQVGEVVGVGGAAQEPQQGDVVDVRQLLSPSPSRWPSPNAIKARAQGLLERLTHAQIRGQRQRRQ
jgi:hypothetical protein